MGRILAALPEDTRQGRVETTDATIEVTDTGIIQATTSMRTATYEDEANTLRVSIEWWNDRINDWQETASSTWEGGQRTQEGELNPAPSLGIGLADAWHGKRLRTVLTTGRSVEYSMVFATVDV